MMLFVLFGSIGFVVLSVLLAIYRGQEPGIPVLVAVSVVFFGGCGIIGAAELIRPTVFLRIDEVGVHATLRWPNTSFDLPWDELERVEVKKLGDQQFVVLFPKNPDFGIRQTKGFQRNIQFANLGMMGSWMAISPKMFGIGLDSLTEGMMDRWQAAVGPTDQNPVT